MDLDWLNGVTAYSCDVAHAVVDVLGGVAVEPISASLVHFLHNFLESCTGGIL